MSSYNNPSDSSLNNHQIPTAATLTSGSSNTEQSTDVDAESDYDSSISMSLFSSSSMTQHHSHPDETPYLSSILDQRHIMRSIATELNDEINPPGIHDRQYQNSSKSLYGNNNYSLNEKLWMNALHEEDEENTFDQGKTDLPLVHTNATNNRNLDNVVEELSKTFSFTIDQALECKQFLPLSLPPPVIEPFYSFSIRSPSLLSDNSQEQLKIMLTVVNALNSFMPLTTILEPCSENGTCALPSDNSLVTQDIRTTDLTVDFDIRPAKQRFQGVIYSNACTSAAAAALFSLQLYVNDDQCIVEFQRRYGDCRVFCKFFRALKELIGQSYEIQSKPFPNLQVAKNADGSAQLAEASAAAAVSMPPPLSKSSREAIHDLGLCDRKAAEVEGAVKPGSLTCYMHLIANLIPFMRSQILSKQQDAMRLFCDIFAPRTNNNHSAELSTSSSEDNGDCFNINIAVEALLEHEKQFGISENRDASPSSFSDLLTSLLSSNDWELRYYTSTLCYYLAQYPSLRENFMSKGSPLYKAMCQTQHHPSSTAASSSIPSYLPSVSSQTLPTAIPSFQGTPLRSPYLSSEDDDDYQFRNSRRQLAKALHTCG